MDEAKEVEGSPRFNCNWRCMTATLSRRMSTRMVEPGRPWLAANDQRRQSGYYAFFATVRIPQAYGVRGVWTSTRDEGAMVPWLTVVGIGEDGFFGLGRAARRALLDAAIIIGGDRHLAMLPAKVRARRESWPKPFDTARIEAYRGSPVCVLASGDQRASIPRIMARPPPRSAAAGSSASPGR